MSLLAGNIGPEAQYDVSVVEGKLVIDIKQQGSIGGAEVKLNLSVRTVLEALKAAIPGQIDDMLINAAEAALGL